MSPKKAIIILLILALTIAVVMTVMYFNLKQRKAIPSIRVESEYQKKPLTPEEKKEQMLEVLSKDQDEQEDTDKDKLSQEEQTKKQEMLNILSK